MSIHGRFPTDTQVSEAYRNVLVRNVYLDDKAEAIEQETRMLRELDKAFGQPSEPAQASLEALEDAAAPEEDKNLTALDKRYGRLFSAIGIQLETTDTSDPLQRHLPVVHSRIVPDLVEVDRFTGYIQHIGYREVYADPTHMQLAKDVIWRIHDVVRQCETEISHLQSISPPDRLNVAVHALQSSRNETLVNFRRLTPIYFAANFHTFIPTYSALERRILDRRTRSL